MKRVQHIFLMLANSETPITSDFIANHLKVSKRTIKYEMEDVSKFTKENGGFLKSKRGTGYWIEVENNILFQSALHQLNIKNLFSFNYNVEIDSDYIIIMQHLIVQDEYFKVEDISRSFYISDSLTHDVLSKFRDFLNVFQLNLESKPNYGQIIVGDELSRRIAMLTLFQTHYHKINYDNSPGRFFSYFEDNQKELFSIRNILLTVLRDRNFSVIDIYTQVLSRYLILQKKRSSSGSKIYFNKKFLKSIKKFNRAYNTAKEIFVNLSQYYNQEIDEHEICAFTLLLIISRDVTIETDIKREYTPIWELIQEIVQGYLNRVASKDLLPIDNNDLLFNYFSAYLTPIISQKYFNLTFLELFRTNRSFLDNPDSLSIDLTNEFLEFMNDFYNVRLSTSLIQNITIDFFIITRKIQIKKSKKPVNILISSNNGIESAKNIRNLLNNFLSENVLGKIDCIELYEGRNFSNEVYDIFVLEGIDSIVYNYEWPFTVINANDFENDFQKLINHIHHIYVENDYR